ncbi:hypothetical protein B0H13DRAFT_1923179 [Mycena leptocephala]|nr:hypothetical protein B0H13DRAFT_1923179 [Mycena leptocephala]
MKMTRKRPLFSTDTKKEDDTSTLRRTTASPQPHRRSLSLPLPETYQNLQICENASPEVEWQTAMDDLLVWAQDSSNWVNPETSLQEGTDQTEAAAPNEESTTERKERERREMQWEVVMRLVMDGMREPDRRRMRTEYDAENDWAGSNPAPLSVQGMGPGGRQDVFGDGWVDWAASRSAPLEYID